MCVLWEIYCDDIITVTWYDLHFVQSQLVQYFTQQYSFQLQFDKC